MIRRHKKYDVSRERTNDEMFEEFLKSRGICRPKPSFFNIAEEIVEFIDNPDLAEKYCAERYQKEVRRMEIHYRHFFNLCILIIPVVVFIMSLGIWYLIVDDYAIIRVVKCALLFGFVLLIGIYGFIAIEDGDWLLHHYKNRYVDKKIKEHQWKLEKYDLSASNKFNRYINALQEWENTKKKLKIGISWKDVSFKDGEVICFSYVFNRPYNCIIERSKTLYDRYRLLLMDNFPKLHYSFFDEKFHLCTDEVNSAIDIIIAYISEEEAERERKEKEERVKERIEREKIVEDFFLTYPHFKREHDEQERIRNRIKQGKSAYLNYLLEHQLDGIDIMTVNEDRTTISTSWNQAPDKQKGYIFFLRMDRSNYCVIYENVFDDNASIKYINDSLPRCLEASVNIKLFMQSNKSNKREKIAHTRKIGDLRVRRIMHDDFVDWKQKVHSRMFR